MEAMTEDDRKGLGDAYKVATPDDNRRLYDDWAGTYDETLRRDYAYVYPERLAALFDQGFVVDETTDLTQAQEPQEYTAIMDAALGYFDEAIALARQLRDDRPDVVLLPHIGSATRETRAAMAKLQRDNIAAVLSGGPLLTAVN